MRYLSETYNTEINLVDQDWDLVSVCILIITIP